MKIEEAVKQNSFKTPKEKAWINMIYTYNHIMGHIGNVFKQFDITHQQYNVLRILRGRLNKTACCAEVKEVMLDKNPDLTRLCDRLVSKGLIEREINPDNRRQIDLRITSNGLILLAEIDPALEDNAKIFNSISNEEAQQLSDLLDKLRG